MDSETLAVALFQAVAAAFAERERATLTACNAFPVLDSDDATTSRLGSSVRSTRSLLPSTRTGPPTTTAGICAPSVFGWNAGARLAGPQTMRVSAVTCLARTYGSRDVYWGRPRRPRESTHNSRPCALALYARLLSLYSVAGGEQGEPASEQKPHARQKGKHLLQDHVANTHLAKVTKA